MYCTHCGAKLNDDARFCTSCGAAVEIVEGQGREPHEKSPELKASLNEDDLVRKQSLTASKQPLHIKDDMKGIPKKKNKKSRKGKILKIALSVIVIALIACGGVLWYINTHGLLVRSKAQKNDVSQSEGVLDGRYTCYENEVILKNFTFESDSHTFHDSVWVKGHYKNSGDGFILYIDDIYESYAYTDYLKKLKESCTIRVSVRNERSIQIDITDNGSGNIIDEQSGIYYHDN